MTQLPEKVQDEQERPAVETPSTPAATHPLIQIDDSKVVSLYANFCRVTDTPQN